ncbi:MAG: hypothetical protein A4E53_01263 [Pelotomaculum sp. PtaB.Bin104]|nr:MAG: hypothetical protein A4E53_01263 [Pelotomaculum sp. PtaB.Bin104]
MEFIQHHLFTNEEYVLALGAAFMKQETFLNQEEGFSFEKPVMTFTTAITNIYAAHDNLSTAINHYDNRNNLCSTIMDTLEAYNDLSTVINLIQNKLV